MLSEHSTYKTQARAFSWFAFSGNMGIFLGPVIGMCGPKICVRRSTDTLSKVDLWLLLQASILEFSEAFGSSKNIRMHYLPL